MKELEADTVENSEFVEQTFKFWFSDNEHIRSPFPNYIRTELQKKATALFYEWSKGLNKNAKDELNDEVIAEKFEEIIFEIGSNLVKTEDERITILYPFMPRTDDQITNQSNEEGIVIDRWIEKVGDESFLWVKCKNVSDDSTWKTSFELPL